jgi:hypothetical protein
LLKSLTLAWIKLMMAPREFYHSDDYVVITVDIEDCPLVEFPLTELFDIATSTVVDNYLEVVQDYVTQLIEDTTWLDTQSAKCLLCSRLRMYHRRNEGELLSLRQPALQRLITQKLRFRNGVNYDPIEVPLFIRFMNPDITLPRKTRFPTAISRISRSIASIFSNEAHGFDGARSYPCPIPGVLCPSTTKMSTLTGTTSNCSARRIMHTEDLDCSDTTLDAALVTTEDVEYYNASSRMTLPECKSVNCPYSCIQSQLLILDTVQHTAVTSTSSDGVATTPATSTIADMGTLPYHIAMPVSFWADNSCHHDIEDFNRLLPSIGMKFHPIDRGRLRSCTS